MPHAVVAVNVACRLVFADIVNGPHALVPVQEALPVVNHPLNVEPAPGTAVHAPIDVPEE